MTAQRLEVADYADEQHAAGGGAFPACPAPDQAPAAADRSNGHRNAALTRPHGDSDQWTAGVRAGLSITASTDPAVVFASLAAQCVPGVCDSCVIDLTEADADYRIACPPMPGLAIAGPTAKAGATSDEALRLRFARRFDSGSCRANGSEDCREQNCCSLVEGVASFTWCNRTPTIADRILVDLLIEHALRTVAWQRSEQRARAAAAKVDDLNTALESSRQIGAAIGILMSLHKITECQAFDLLRVASQHAHRKLRDLAFDVVDTGWLDPALVKKAALRLAPSAAGSGPGKTVRGSG